MAFQNSSDPEFIKYLLSPEEEYDTYFIVGNMQHMEPERIGAVKKMLMSKSPVFRRQLGESKLRERKEINIIDLHPDTFRNILRYVYGHDTTQELTFDEADNMFYAADKYLMSPLKDKLACRLMSLLTPENVCSLLNNPACYTHLQLDSAITQILRYETDKVLKSPSFLQLCDSGFLKILEQDGLVVPEIELWRAAVQWATKNATEDRSDVRRQLSRPLKHLKICTLMSEQFLEVEASGVLSGEEVILVSQSIRTGEKIENVMEFCNDITPRIILEKPSKLEFFLQHLISGHHEAELKVSRVSHRNCVIELLSLQCRAVKREGIMPAGTTYWMNGCSMLIREYNSLNDIYPKFKARVHYTGRQVQYGEDFEIPLTENDGRNIRLIFQHNMFYSINMVFHGHGYQMFQGNQNYRNEHISVILKDYKHYNSKVYVSPVRELRYRFMPQCP